MLIFLRARLVLFAVEKTGTTALQKALDPLADIRMRGNKIKPGKHATFLQYKEMIEPELLAAGEGPFEYVAVCRNPVDWLNSWYRYRSRDELVGKANSSRGLTFDEFVQGCCSTPKRSCCFFKSQSHRLCDADGKVSIHHLFRYEDMDKLVAFLERRLGQSIALGKVNVSPPGDTRLSEATLAKMRQAFQADFAIYESLGPPA